MADHGQHGVSPQGYLNWAGIKKNEPTAKQVTPPPRKAERNRRTSISLWRLRLDLSVVRLIRGTYINLEGAVLGYCRASESASGSS